MDVEAMIAQSEAFVAEMKVRTAHLPEVLSRNMPLGCSSVGCDRVAYGVDYVKAGDTYVVVAICSAHDSAVHDLVRLVEGMPPKSRFPVGE